MGPSLSKSSPIRFYSQQNLRFSLPHSPKAKIYLPTSVSAMEDSLSQLFIETTADPIPSPDLLAGTVPSHNNLLPVFQSLDNSYNESPQPFVFEVDPCQELDGVQPPAKRTKLSSYGEGEQQSSHIAVERKRRKQMNEHLSVLRSFMPCFYVKRGDQASIIGGVVDYIKELQQILKSLEEKKHRKIYPEVLSPRAAISSPRLLPPLSPRLTLPLSPRTPQSRSPYKPKVHQQSHLSSIITANIASSLESSSSFDSPSITSSEIAASSTSHVADIKVKFVGANVEVKTLSHRIPRQALKIMSILEGRSLEILHASISVIDDTMFNCFTLKIGMECELSAEELAQEIQQTFAY